MERFGILVELTTATPVLRLVGEKGHISMDGWQVDATSTGFVVREARPVGLKVNGKALKSLELVDGDQLVVGRDRFLWKDFERPKIGR